MTASSAASTPSPDAESGTIDDQLEKHGHTAAPEPDTISTSSGERVPEPDQDGTVTDCHVETADRLDHAGDDH